MKRYWLGFITLFFSTTSPHAHAAPPTGIEVLSSYTLEQATLNNMRITELSGLAWDNDESILYAISDKGGRLFQFKLELNGNAIQRITPLQATYLTDAKNQRIKNLDAEGLTLLNHNNHQHGDTQLILSSEGQPRILRLNAQGKLLNTLPLSPPLRNLKNYRGNNNALEAVTYHPRWGMITAPELPLRTASATEHTLYSAKRTFSFPAHTATNSGITALETLPDGNILVLERAWSGVLNPMVISLRYVNLQQCDKTQHCPVHDLKAFENYLLVDNFEGLTHIQGDQYLMVSDDGDNTFLRTQLLLFRLTSTE